MAYGGLMTRLDRYLLVIGAIIALIASASLIGNGIGEGIQRAGPFVDGNPPNRWSIQQTDNYGWLLFDNRDGRFCTVPNAQSINQQINCTRTPPNS
jgi:hypothetical protein